MQKPMKPSSLKINSLTRRDFLRRTSLAAGTAALTFPYVANGQVALNAIPNPDSSGL